MSFFEQVYFKAKYFAQEFLHGGESGKALKYWTGSGWTSKTLKYWDGSAWQAKTLKAWNGSTWV